MTTKRLVHLLVALGLVASALAGTVLPAGAQPPGPEVPGQNAIFYPYIPNGVDIEEGNGPWYGVITVQNLEDLPIDIKILEPGTGDEITSAVLNPHASKTFSAALLGIDDESAGAVYVTASFQSIGDAIDAGLCAVEDFPVTRGSDEGGSDTFSTDPPFATPDRARVPGFTLNTDYKVTISGSDVTIDWSPDGNEPDADVVYTVRVWDCPTPRISGTEKHASVDLSPAGRTSEDTVAVTGYTALPLSDLALSRNLPADSLLDDVLGETGQWNWAFPIVQTNNGWNSVIHVTNFSDVDNCGITVIFYESPSGFSDPSFGSFTTLLDAGQMVDVDLLKEGFPTGVNDWVGQAWVSADCAVAATVDRLKDETNMALTLIPQPRVDTGDYEKHGPLVFENFNGWNTGITMANLSDTDANTVTVSFYNQAGQLVSSEQRVLQPRAVEYIYRPSTGDVGTGGPFGDLQQVVISGTAPLAAAADSVKYQGERLEGQGQALSYLLQGGASRGQHLSVPLIQKGTSLAPSGQFSGDTSGVALFNGSDSQAARVAYAFYDQTGALVAPTLTGPVVTTIGPLAGAVLYTPFFGEMPNGFQGSFDAWVLSGNGPVSCVSNNVNYDVVGDGTAAYNCAVSRAGYALTLEPEEAVNLVGEPHTVTATLTLDGVPVEDVLIHFVVSSAEGEGNPIPEVGEDVTDAGGQATFTYTNTISPDLGGEFTEDVIYAFADFDEDGVRDPDEPSAVAEKMWIGVELTLDPASAVNVIGDTHTVTATLTDSDGNPISDVDIIFSVTSGGNPEPSGDVVPTDGLGQAEFAYTNDTAGTDTITACADMNGNGEVDATDVCATAAKTWVTAGPAYTVDPAVATNPVEINEVLQSHTVTVSVIDAMGDPFAGVDVTFTVVSGPNTGETSATTTDGSGVATFTYTSNGTLGLDEIEVWVDLDNDGVVDDGETDVVTKEWVLGLSRVLTCLPEADTNPVGSEHTVTCTLTDGAGNPVEGVELSANIDPGPNSAVTPTCGVTDADGQATCTYLGTGGLGTDTITITGDSAFDTVTKTWQQMPA